MSLLKHKMRLPAEWEPQLAALLAWPHENTDWADTLGQVLPVFAQTGAAVSQDQILLSVCRDAAHQQQVADQLRRSNANPANLRYALADSNDVWARDHGPISTLGQDGLTLHNFQFDGWGGKYPADKDNAINACLLQQGAFGDVPMLDHAWVLEGGALETDGQGSLLATRRSVLDGVRNPGVSQADIEQRLRTSLGVERFLWLAQGALSGDDTDGHIDLLARFTDPQTIVYSTVPAGDEDYAELAAMQDELAQLRTPTGDPYRLIALPFPGIHRDVGGRRLPASYANYLLTNRSVLVPGYGVPQDQQAGQIFMHCFPGRRVILIDCRTLITQGGSLHCLAMPIHKPCELLPSLQEYVLCSQDVPAIEIYRQSNDWRMESYVSGQSTHLESVDMALVMDDLYDFLR